MTDTVPVSFSRLPAAFDGYRIAQLSDVHAAVFGEGNSTLLSGVRNLKPDIIVITGDLISDKSDIPTVEPLITGLTAVAPVYFVTGNHEWDTGGIQTLFKMLQSHGVTVLRNSCVRLTRSSDAIDLVGLDDPNGPADMKTPEEVISSVREEDGDPFLVVLYHRNNALARFAAMDVDLVLSGHAHGGLIRLPFTDGLIGPSREWLPKYTSGVYVSGGTKMFVSRGLGNKTGGPRFLNNPELPLIVLHRY